MTPRPLTSDLADLRRADLPAAGGKAVNLGELLAAGLPVPPGFAVLTDAYRAVTDPIRADIVRLATDQGAAATPAIQDLIENAPVPKEVASAIAGSYAALGGTVAVRSSATEEDLEGASFAGQQDTYLGIEGAEAVLAAVRKCWASLWTERAIDYRARQGIAPGDVALAVVVQRIVDARAAGVMFTADPATGRRDVCMISAAWGLGEAVVSAQVTTDDLVVRREPGEGAGAGSALTVESRHTADKARMTVLAGGGSELVDVAQALRRARCWMTRRQWPWPASALTRRTGSAPRRTRNGRWTARESSGSCSRGPSRRCRPRRTRRPPSGPCPGPTSCTSAPRSSNSCPTR